MAEADGMRGVPRSMHSSCLAATKGFHRLKPKAWKPKT